MQKSKKAADRGRRVDISTFLFAASLTLTAAALTAIAITVASGSMNSRENLVLSSTGSPPLSELTLNLGSTRVSKDSTPVVETREENRAAPIEFQSQSSARSISETTTHSVAKANIELSGAPAARFTEEISKAVEEAVATQNAIHKAHEQAKLMLAKQMARLKLKGSLLAARKAQRLAAPRVSPHPNIMLASITPDPAPLPIATSEPIPATIEPIATASALPMIDEQVATRVSTDAEKLVQLAALSPDQVRPRSHQEILPVPLALNPPSTETPTPAKRPRPLVGKKPGAITKPATETAHVLAYAPPNVDTEIKASPYRGLDKIFKGSKRGLPGPNSKIAVYDISAAVVHMPDGSKLKANSGIGHRMNKPKYAYVKNLGPTPPNVYKLRMRERRFHGVEAIRMLPYDVAAMRGRDGMLAHTPLLRNSKGSHGCVAFPKYNKFLKAFKQGKVKTMIVVPDMSKLPKYMALYEERKYASR